MKPLSLKVTAFGPYAKETFLDFSKDLEGQDIFVVTGPTGAGKTTIFDAICYALYGETSGGSRTGKELRSDFAKDSDLKTEIEFIFKVKDKSYRIVRAPQQLQKKKRGSGYREVPATVELLELGSEQAPLTKESDVREAIAEIIGLKVEQFRKIVMIPQGDFKEFLLANTSNKEEILRKIFGTDFYKFFQEQLSERAKALKEEVGHYDMEIKTSLKLIKTDADFEVNGDQRLESNLEKIEIQRERWQSQLNQYEVQKDEINQQLKECQSKRDLGIQLNDKFTEYENTQQALIELAKQEGLISQYKRQLALAKAASSLRPYENEKVKLEARYRETLSQKTAHEEELKKLENEFILVQKCYETIPELNEQAVLLTREKEKLSAYKEDVSQLASKVKQLEEMKAEGLKLKQEYERLEHELNDLKGHLSTEEEKRAQLDDKKEELHAMKLKSLTNQNDYHQALRLKKNVEEFVRLDKHVQMLEKEVSLLIEEATTKRQAYDYQADLFIHATAIRLANELKVGEACPVCGSLEHPNPRRSNEPILTKEELNQRRQQVEALEEDSRFKREQLTKLQTQASGYKEEIERLVSELKERQLIENEFELQEASVAFLCRRLEEEKQRNYEQVEAMTSLIQNIERELKELEEVKQRLASLEQSKVDCEKRLQEQRERYQVEQRSKKDLEERIPKDYHSLGVLTKRLNELVKEYEKINHDIKLIDENYRNMDKEISSLRVIIHEKNKESLKLEAELKVASEQFMEELHQHFSEVNAYEEAKLWESHISVYEQNIQKYQQDVHAVSARQKQLSEELVNQSPVDVLKYDELIFEFEQQKNELTKQEAKLTEHLKYNEELVRSIEKNYERIKKQEQEYAIVGELDSLANGRSGRKMSFETYVLSSYFDEVLEAANTRLQKMTARRYYLLRRQDVKGGGRKGLDLDVYDSHTCKQRPVNTLSGGESFKASLALALGLSDVVQQNSGGTQLDTMFIDEGFGTLDSESLDQAIDILMELQDHGRLIGVISHVNELKERIPVKLMVETDGTGSRAFFKK